MGLKGTLSGHFLEGENDTLFCTDWRYLTPDEKISILTFIKDIDEQTHVIGKNKESWLDDDRDEILGAEGYKDENYWHYHCGPGWYHNTFRCMTKCLYFNPGGKASHECIHYYPVPEENGKIVVVGYSRIHIPFLRSDDPRNPFFK
ncbi:hypothetical protein [Pantoea sp. EKM20T]|uniref:hypothetical protein n=1 Tax=Pantoea sp. EKM20T TaxID=2708059 RepID=UPI00142E240C|nr:hypothetical protein [Pantoea sp. EKM20T]KAF6685042.1 hypothetical protein HFD94_04790 [Pantoea sp. EKM20T]